jgi:hypothetical protein
MKKKLTKKKKKKEILDFEHPIGMIAKVRNKVVIVCDAELLDVNWQDMPKHMVKMLKK